MANTSKVEIRSHLHEASSLADANNHLALNLHKKFSLEKKNVFFSPFSISTALAMVYRGAREETSAEMRQVLGFNSANLSDEQVHGQFEKLLAVLSENQDSYTLAVANSIVSQKDFPLLPEYKTDLQTIYRALTMEVDFVNDGVKAVSRINDWVKEKTQGMIPKIFDSLDPATVMVLLNAVYFKGTWLHRFDPQDTHPQPFYNNGKKDNIKEAPMMYLKKKFLFAEKESYKVLELPYKGKDIAMLLLLPHEIDGLSKLEQNLSADFISVIRNDLREVKVEVILPKFRLEYSKELKSIFQNLGMKRVFECNANFKGLSNCDQIKVSEIIHKAVLDVNEEGSEAAAVTAVVMMMCSLQMNPEFRADHPFLFVIYDKRNELILFMGRMEEM